MNLLDCTFKDDQLAFGEFDLPVSDRVRSALGSEGSKLVFGIRPEFIVASNEAHDGWIRWKTSLVENVGNYQLLTLSSNGIQIKSRVPENMRISDGDSVWVQFPEDKIKLFRDDKRVY